MLDRILGKKSAKEPDKKAIPPIDVEFVECLVDMGLVPFGVIKSCEKCGSTNISRKHYPYHSNKRDSMAMWHFIDREWERHCIKWRHKHPDKPIPPIKQTFSAWPEHLSCSCCDCGFEWGEYLKGQICCQYCGEELTAKECTHCGAPTEWR